MENRLRYLLDGHLNKTLNPGETEEFQEYVRLGQNADLIRQEIEDALQWSSTGQIDPGVGSEIYDRILSDHDIPKPVRLGLGWYLRKFGVAALVVLGLGMAWVFVPRKIGTNTAVVAVQPVQMANKIYKNKSYILLPDGSTVLLKEGSQLTVIDKGGRFSREVVLEGEAFFDIAHDEGRNFIVRTGSIRTKVLGTAFHIRSETGRVEVKVTRGLVEVGNDQKVFGKLRPKEQMLVSTESNDFKITGLTMKGNMPSENTNMVFEEATLSSVFEQIEKKFHTHIFLEHPEIGKCRISADFSRQDKPDDILGAICEMRQAEFKVELDKILIKGGATCN
jgi:transmembrane sensor